MATALIVPPPSTRKGPPCTVCLLLSRLDAPERQALETMLTDKAWTGVDIADTIAAKGYAVIQGGTISRHRRGRCRGL